MWKPSMQVAWVDCGSLGFNGGMLVAGVGFIFLRVARMMQWIPAGAELSSWGAVALFICGAVLAGAVVAISRVALKYEYHPYEPSQVVYPGMMGVAAVLVPAALAVAVLVPVQYWLVLVFPLLWPLAALVLEMEFVAIQHYYRAAGFARSQRQIDESLPLPDAPTEQAIRRMLAVEANED